MAFERKKRTEKSEKKVTLKRKDGVGVQAQSQLQALKLHAVSGKNEPKERPLQKKVAHDC